MVLCRGSTPLHPTIINQKKYIDMRKTYGLFFYIVSGDTGEKIHTEIEHEEHSYLLFDGYGVIHNPNCKCNKEED